MEKEFVFPADFRWGTAMSAHQTEGNNKNSDWWAYENDPKYSSKLKEPSLIACDSYNRYEEDFDLCVKLNSNSVRISIEWARIEPSEGVFDEVEIAHYKKVLEAAKRRNLTTFVTLHHFTNPVWFMEKGGWLSRRSSFYFARYARKCAESFHTLIDFFLTINEPQVYMYQSFVIGEWPPFKKNYFSALSVRSNMIRANNTAYTLIKKVCNNPVGVVENITWFQPAYGKYFLKFIDLIKAKWFYFLNSDFFLMSVKKHIDFIGLNHYTTGVIKNLAIIKKIEPYGETGWWLNPMGIEKVLLSLRRYKLPIYITESGLAEGKKNDQLRIEYIKDTLAYIALAMKKGVQVKGYLHWSLIDNFEWHIGYSAKFGLVEIDRSNQLARIPRESFFFYATICEKGKICLSS